MLQKTFESYILLFSVPILISFLLGSLLVYINFCRNVRIQKKLKSNFLYQIENEKIKISRELHDSIMPLTLPLKEFIRKRGSFTDENEKEWLSEINNFEVYLSKINDNIFPSELLDGDLIVAIQKLVSRLTSENKIFEIQSNLDSSISKANSIQIFRIIQETLINAIKYSGSNYFNILINQEGNCLNCSIIYEFMESGKSDDTIVSFKRGQKIITQRLELLSGKYELIKDHNVKTEKFTFKDVFP
jgi:signal transduction histidine kinase